MKLQTFTQGKVLLQITNDVFTKKMFEKSFFKHIYLKANLQVTNKWFLFVDNKIHLQIVLRHTQGAALKYDKTKPGEY